MKIRETHNRGAFEDKTLLEVNQYGDRGLNLGYFHRTLLDSDVATSQDMEALRLEACKAYIQYGGEVVISVIDSAHIPENDRNAPLDGNADVVDGRLPKKQTGDPGDQYYDWQPLDQVDQRINKTQYLINKKKI